MRTHGWGGDVPASDEEALERILSASRRCMDLRGRDVRIADVAAELGVTRQTVYRYFPSTDALLIETALRAAIPFMARVTARVKGLHMASDAVLAAVVMVIDELIAEPYLGIVLSPGEPNRMTANVTGATARAFGAALFRGFEIDWSAQGFDDATFTELVEHVLRILQSLVVDPGDPARHGAAMQAYLDRWLRPAIDALRLVPVGQQPAP